MLIRSLFPLSNNVYLQEEQWFEKVWDYQCPGFVYTPISENWWIIYFHGNGTDLNAQKPIMRKIGDTYNKKVLSVDYPGYTNCVYPKTFASIKKIANTLEHYIAQNIPSEETIVVSHSIGTTLSALLSHMKRKWLLMIAPYSTLWDLVQNKLWKNIFTQMYKSPIDVVNLIASWEKNVLLITHGTNDQIIPYNLGKKLYEELYSNKYPVHMITVEWWDHNDIFSKIFVDDMIKNFLKMWIVSFEK
jgi:uncharacterized protein